MAEACPIRVGTPKELPGPFAPGLSTQLGRGEAIHSLIWVPADRRGLTRDAGTPARWALTGGDQVLVTTGRRLIIGAQRTAGENPRWVAIPYDRVLAWATTRSLLYGRLDVCAEEGGRLVKASLEFNTVGRWMVEEALLPLEATALGMERRPTPAGARDLPDLPGIPLKFVNVLRHELRPGENLDVLLFERAVITRVFGLWARLQRPAQAIATTEFRQLIIREEAGSDAARYGHTVVSVPHRCTGILVMEDTGARLGVRLSGETATIEPTPIAVER